jgi:hypothetical protein
MDELALMSVPENSTGQGGALMMQQVAGVRDEMTRGKDWVQIARTQWTDIWSKVCFCASEEKRKESCGSGAPAASFFCASARTTAFSRANGAGRSSGRAPERSPSLERAERAGVAGERPNDLLLLSERSGQE